MKIKDLFENSDIENSKVVIIKGNPEKMKGMEDIAEKYYQDISDYVKALGYTVEFDFGEEYTCPSMDAAFWIAHSRGVDREVCIPKENKDKFLKFGSLDGIIHPVDQEWQESINDHRISKEMPPKEHFIFTNAQKNAINKLVNTNSELQESIKYNNWSMPDQKTMKADFDEYKFKEYKKWKDRANTMGMRFPLFKSFSDYVNTLSTGKVITVTNEIWHRVGNLSDNSSIEDIETMVSGYYMPRDVQRIKNGFESDVKIPYPVILKGKKGGLFIMSGNTRLNVAKVLGITPKSLLIDISE